LALPPNALVTAEVTKLSKSPIVFPRKLVQNDFMAK
jgi:hypothetical protein